MLLPSRTRGLKAFIGSGTFLDTFLLSPFCTGHNMPLRTESFRIGTLIRCMLFMVITLVEIHGGTTARALDLFPSEDALDKYRRSWTPITHGSLLIPVAETPPKGRLILSSFVFGQVGDGQYHNTLTTRVSAAPVNTNSAVPGGMVIYGLTDYVSMGAGLSGIYWKSTDVAGEHNSTTGLGDTSLFLNTLHRVQDPETWQPSFSLYHRISLPTSHWAGTQPPPGGFEAFSIRPSTRFGALSLTEGLVVTKNFRPVRVSSAIYYTYNTPGSQFGGTETAYVGDLLDVRMSLEHVFHEDRGFGVLLGALVRQGLPYRLDGHDLNVSPVNFSLIGVSAGLEYRFTPNLLANVGCLFTVAGQNDVHAFYPGLSIKYSWDGLRASIGQ